MRVVVKQPENRERELVGEFLDSGPDTQRRVATPGDHHTGQSVPDPLATEIGEDCVFLHH